MRIQVKLEADHYLVTMLTGKVLDQAMLLEVLNYVYDLGMPIDKVNG